MARARLQSRFLGQSRQALVALCSLGNPLPGLHLLCLSPASAFTAHSTLVPAPAALASAMRFCTALSRLVSLQSLKDDPHLLTPHARTCQMLVALNTVPKLVQIVKGTCGPGVA